MKIVYPSLAFLLITLIASAAPFIVKDGEARAEIVLADDAPRSTRFAVRDLQVYLEKMSGAKLAVVPKPSGKGLVKIFVGDYVKFLSYSIQPRRNVGIGIECPSPRLRSEIEDRPMSRRKMNAAAIRVMFVQRKTHVFMGE